MPRNNRRGSERKVSSSAKTGPIDQGRQRARILEEAGTLGTTSKNPVYEAARRHLRRRPRTWLVTGCAGFIGSHLVEALLHLGQRVVGMDNFATGHPRNLTMVRQAVGKKAWRKFRFLRGDVTRLSDCRRAVRASAIHFILHQAGLGSVPRSIADPLRTHAVNVTGTLNLLVAARDAGVRRFVYAASSSTYGDSTGSPKREDQIGRALSPYAVSKHANELYARVFGRCYGMETFGLRYFNVFGPRQDPCGAYAAVIPRWIGEIQAGRRNVIYGDGKTSRDFCYVDNVVQANLLAALAPRPESRNEVYNIACGEATSLVQLHRGIRQAFLAGSPGNGPRPPLHRPFRKGDVRHSLASIAKARSLLGYRPTDLIGGGLAKTVNWYLSCRP